MKITNKHRLPEPIIKALQRSKYKKGFCNYTVSELISPPQMKKLFEKYGDQIEVDASDMLYALDGTALHDLLDRTEKGRTLLEKIIYLFSNIISEKRIYYMHNGFKIGGKPDRLIVNKKTKSVTIQDYKKVKVYEYLFGFKKEKEIQLNLYAYYWMLQGYNVEELEIVAFFKDFSKRQAKFNPEYPKSPIVTIKVPVWTREKIEKYIKERLALHNKKDLPECTKEERWNVGDKFAVKKKGVKRALRVFKTKEEAKEYIERQDLPNLYIEYRPGENIRCEDWCLVKDFCEQYKRSVKNEKI